MKQRKRKAHRRREDWRALVSEWRSSGQTAEAFALARDLSRASLFHWSSIFKREAEPGMTSRLVPVRVAMPMEERAAQLELTVGPLRLRFDEGAAPRYVAAVAKALMDAASI